MWLTLGVEHLEATGASRVLAPLMISDSWYTQES
jgi:hypothetical protein